MNNTATALKMSIALRGACANAQIQNYQFARLGQILLAKRAPSGQIVLVISQSIFSQRQKLILSNNFCQIINRRIISHLKSA